MLDDWQRRLEEAPVFGPTFEGFDYKTPQYERLDAARSNINELLTKENVSTKEIQSTADEFKNAFIANRKNLQSQLGPDVTPVNELLDRFYQISPGATQLIRNRGDADSYRHEIYSHLYPYQAGLSPDYRGFTGNVINYPASPITPLNEGVATWVDRGMRSPIGDVKPDSPENLGNYFKDFVDRVAENDRAFFIPGGFDIWKQQYGEGKDLQRTHELGSLFREKYLEPATKRYQNLAQAQANPGAVTPNFNRGSSMFNQLISDADSLNDELKFAGKPELFTNSFIEKNLLFSADPVSAAVAGAGDLLKRNTTGALAGAATSALDPSVAQDVQKNKFASAASTIGKGAVGGAVTEAGIQAAAPTVARFAPGLMRIAAPVARVAGPVAVGAALFGQGQTGSLTDVLAQKAANYVPGLRPNPKTDIGRMAGHAISNEAMYAFNQLKQGKLPWTR